jgi:hypothetical protein
MLLVDGNVMADCMRAARSGRFPLVVYLHVVSQLVQHTPLFDVSKCEKDSWWDLHHCDKTESGQRLNFVVRVLEVLLAGCGVSYKEVRMQHAVCLKQFFQVPKLTHILLYHLQLGFELHTPGIVSEALLSEETYSRYHRHGYILFAIGKGC